MQQQQVDDGEAKIAYMMGPWLQGQDKLPKKIDGAKDGAEEDIVSWTQHGPPKVVAMCSILAKIYKVFTQKKRAEGRPRHQKKKQAGNESE